MATDRYIAIIEPLRYVTLMTSRRATIMIALAWLIPLILDYIPALCTRLGKCNLEDKALVSTKMTLLEILPFLLKIMYRDLIGRFYRQPRGTCFISSASCEGTRRAEKKALQMGNVLARVEMSCDSFHTNCNCSTVIL